MEIRIMEYSEIGCYPNTELERISNIYLLHRIQSLNLLQSANLKLSSLCFSPSLTGRLFSVCLSAMDPTISAPFFLPYLSNMELLFYTNEEIIFVI